MKKNTGKIVAAVFIASMFLVSSTIVVNAGTKYGRTEIIDEKEIDDKAKIPEQEPSLYDAYEDKVDDVKPDIDDAKPSIDVNDDASPDLEYTQNSMQLQPKAKSPPKKYAVIMVGRYFGLWNYGHPLWNYNMIQQYYKWYLIDAGRMYTTLHYAFGYKEENIFLLVRLLPEELGFEIPEGFNLDWIDYTSSEENLEAILNTFKPGGENELTEDDSLLVCFIDHGGNDGDGGEEWISPTGNISNDWIDEENAYDDDTETCAVFKESQNGWSEPLILTLGEVIKIKGFRIRARNEEHLDKMRIRFYHEEVGEDDAYGEYEREFDDWGNDKWKYVDFEGIEYEEVNKVEIEFHEDAPYTGFSVHKAKVYEFDFWQPDGCGDVGNTFFGCPFYTIPAFLQWIFGSDTQRIYEGELANYVDGINAKMIFVLQPCNSGGFINSLSKENRIICTASRGFEIAEGWFGPFTRALSKEDYADYDGDGNISILEAYRYAAEFVESHSPPESQHPLIDDNYDSIGHHFYETGYYDPDDPDKDGYLANRTYLYKGNYPPNKPRTPECDTWGGYPEIEYTFNSSTTDPEGDEIYYLFDWGDETSSGWLGPYPSGTTVEASHAWTEEGTYEIRVKAKDMVYNEHGGPWSEPFEIQIGQDQSASSSENTQNEMVEGEYNNTPLH